MKFVSINKQIEYVNVASSADLEVAEMDNYLFRIFFLPNGGVQFVNKKQGQGTLMISGTNLKTNTYEDVQEE